MNRLCQSSYGNLEAVINIPNYNGDQNRKLVHFYREQATGQWAACAVVSQSPKSGGSMLQNIIKRYENQEHGDFEVLVLEDGGAVKHYTRDNTIPVDNGIYAWKLSAIVNRSPDLKAGRIAIDAAPLIQSQMGVDGLPDVAILETIIRDSDNRVVHYRCVQRNTNDESAQDDSRYEWGEAHEIPVTATGPCCLYYNNQGKLNALIPSHLKTEHYRFEESKRWVIMFGIPNTLGPCCVYASPVATDLHALVRIGSKVEEYIWGEINGTKTGMWRPSKHPLAPSLSLIRRAAHHQVLPVAVLSQSSSALGRCPNTDAIVFHASGTGRQDSWMVLHWSLLAGTNKWVVSGVVLPHVVGMPL